MHRDEVTLLQIFNAAKLVELFSGDMEQEEFLEDKKTRSAVLYQLLVIGEATKRLSWEFRDEHNEIPWSLMAGMRDHLIHAYDTVNWDEVWRTATKDIPTLIGQLEPLLPEP